MKHLLDKNEILRQRLDSVHEQVFKMGDEYKVRTNISIPKTLVNKFVSKAKKEHDVDPKENWSDIELAQLFVDYILANYLNDESLPVEGILGKQDKEPGAVTDTVEAGTDEPIEETDEEILDDVESVETTVETEEGDEVSSEIQFENKDNKDGKINESLETITRIGDIIDNVGSFSVEDEDLIFNSPDGTGHMIKMLHSTDVELGNGDFISYDEIEELGDTNLLDDILSFAEDKGVEQEKALDRSSDTGTFNESKVDKAELVKNVKKLYNGYIKKGDSKIDKKKLDKIITKDMLDDKTGNVSNALDKVSLMDLKKAQSLLEEPSKKMLDK